MSVLSGRHLSPVRRERESEMEGDRVEGRREREEVGRREMAGEKIE